MYTIRQLSKSDTNADEKKDATTAKKSTSDAGELDEDGELEEGEVSDEDEKRPEENEPKPVCRFYTRGQCTWGMSCRFLHPGVTDKGNYTMFDLIRPIPHSIPYGRDRTSSGGGLEPLLDRMPAGYHHEHSRYDRERSAHDRAGLARDPHHGLPPPLPPIIHHPAYATAAHVRMPPHAAAAAAADAPASESAWERGLRTAKEMMRRASKRKEQDMDFEDKKMHLSAVHDDHEKDNYYIRERGSPDGGGAHPSGASGGYAAASMRHYAVDPRASPPPLHHAAGPHGKYAGQLRPLLGAGPIPMPTPYGSSSSHHHQQQHHHSVGDEHDPYGGRSSAAAAAAASSSSARYRELPPHRMPQYEDEVMMGKRRVRPAREVIVQRAEPAGRGDEWNDPWMRSKSPGRSAAAAAGHGGSGAGGSGSAGGGGAASERRPRRDRRSYSTNSSYSSGSGSSTSRSDSTSNTSRSQSPNGGGGAGTRAASTGRRRQYNSSSGAPPLPVSGAGHRSPIGGPMAAAQQQQQQSRRHANKRSPSPPPSSKTRRHSPGKC